MVAQHRKEIAARAKARVECAEPFGDRIKEGRRPTVLIEYTHPFAALGNARVAQVDMDLPRPIAAFRPPDQKGLDRQRPGAIARIPARTVQKQILAIFETEKRQCDEIALPRLAAEQENGRAAGRERVCQYGSIQVVAEYLK